MFIICEIKFGIRIVRENKCLIGGINRNKKILYRLIWRALSCCELFPVFGKPVANTQRISVPRGKLPIRSIRLALGGMPERLHN